MCFVKVCYLVDYYCRKVFQLKIDCYFWENKIVEYYKIFRPKRLGINLTHKRKRKVIVSMTSIPNRIDKVWIVIESLLRQTYKPDKIILWLSKSEFERNSLPPILKEQQKRGLQIQYCNDLGPHTKYYFTAIKYPNDYIVTVDDDVIYAEDMLEQLIKTYKMNPGSIICHRSHYINMKYGKILAYNKWKAYSMRDDLKEEPTYHNFFTNVAGTFFPMYMMDRIVVDKNVFMKLAPTADDVWLNFCAWISGIKIKNTEGILGNILHIKNDSHNNLSVINVIHRKNDEQIKKVMQYFNIDANRYLLCR